MYFAHDHIQSQIPKDVALCMFRIVQEAVRNAAKHSGANEVNVELSGFGDRIELRVSDSGVGFDPQSEKGRRGLGLLSMSERLRLIGGDLTVESEPSHGTRIRVRVPLPATTVFRIKPRSSGAYTFPSGWLEQAAYGPRIAFFVEETGECGERQLNHSDVDIRLSGTTCRDLHDRA